MSSLTRSERLRRADEMLDENVALSKAATTFDVPYGTLFTLKGIVDIVKVGGKNYLDVNEKFKTWLTGYKPISAEGRRNMGKQMKKSHNLRRSAGAPRKGNGAPEPPDWVDPLTHAEREPGYIEPIKLADVEALSLSGKLAAVNEILRSVADEIKYLQDLKEKIRAVL